MKICQACGQELPNQKRRRICASCEKPIKRHDKWYADGPTIHHKDCANPTGSPEPKQQEQGSLI